MVRAMTAVKASEDSPAIVRSGALVCSVDTTEIISICIRKTDIQSTMNTAVAKNDVIITVVVR